MSTASPISYTNPPQSYHKILTPHFSACGLMPPSQVMSPRLHFAIGLTVEQISQCSGWQLAQRSVESTKKIQKPSMVLWKGRSQKKVKSVGNQFRSKTQKVKTSRKAKIKVRFTCRAVGEPIACHQKKAAKDQLGGKSNYWR